MYNRIIQGDCTAILKTLPDQSVDFVLTDPPYFVRYTDRSGRTIRNDRYPRAGPRCLQRRVPRTEGEQSMCFVLRLEPRGFVLHGVEGRGLHAGRPHCFQKDLCIRPTLPAVLARIRVCSREGAA